MKKTCISLFLALLVTGLGAPAHSAPARPASAQDLEQELTRLDQDGIAAGARQAADRLWRRVEGTEPHPFEPEGVG